jgi:hypothetical protein
MLALDIFLKDYRRADVDGMEKEGEIYALLESNRVPNIAHFGKGNDVRDHTTLTHTQRREVGLLVKRYGGPQALPDVPERCRSAVDFILFLTGVRECHS